jgi:arylsulfatase A
MTQRSSRRTFLRIAGCSLVAGGAARLLGAARPAAKPQAARPNFIVLFCDNLGYGDIGCFGSKRNRTPHIDRMATEGTRFTSFYVTSGVCTPSRSSLMTACYPRRVGLHSGSKGGPVLFPSDTRGLHPDEITIAEVLKDRGYTTACIGKWHLGDQPQFLPTRQGFDTYYGIPYSDDMTGDKKGRGFPPIPLMRDEKVVEAPADRNTLTKRYTKEVIDFITASRDRPFFVYLPHATPGSTRSPNVSDEFRDRSKNGRYGDSVEEIDWSTGEILAAVKKLGLDEKTLVIWTSDNGTVDRAHGSNLPFSGWGYTTTEAAMRMPCVVRWPGKVPAGKTCNELCTTMDLLPTFAKLAGGAPPPGRIIDGKDIRPLLLGEPGAKTPHEAFFYYYMDQLQAVRSGKWKLHLPLKAKWVRFGGKKTEKVPAALYDVVTDVAEKIDLAAKHPEVVQRLTALAEKAREDLGDVGRKGKGQRPAGYEPNPKPQRLAPK